MFYGALATIESIDTRLIKLPNSNLIATSWCKQKPTDSTNQSVAISLMLVGQKWAKLPWKLIVASRKNIISPLVLRRVILSGLPKFQTILYTYLANNAKGSNKTPRKTATSRSRDEGQHL